MSRSAKVAEVLPALPPSVRANAPNNPPKRLQDPAKLTLRQIMYNGIQAADAGTPEEPGKLNGSHLLLSDPQLLKYLDWYR